MDRKAWAAKTLQTQLASWAQLRHDTILYAKQSPRERASTTKQTRGAANLKAPLRG
jgi:hypothetical protein